MDYISCCRILVAALLVTQAISESIHKSESAGVIKIPSDASYETLGAQLRTLGLNVRIAADGQQPANFSRGVFDAYLIPMRYLRNTIIFSDHIEAASYFVRSGGLVIIVDSCVGWAAATRDFVAKSLHYEGERIKCKLFHLSIPTHNINAHNHNNISFGLSTWLLQLLHFVHPSGSHASFCITICVGQLSTHGTRYAYEMYGHCTKCI